MSEKPTAFPSGDKAAHPTSTFEAGMSLRDWFAGQFASQAAARSYGNDWGSNGKEFPVLVSAFAYRLADAMLAERERSR